MRKLLRQMQRNRRRAEKQKARNARTRTARRLRAGTIAAGAFTLAMAAGGPAHAEQILVDTLEDNTTVDSYCTLREAINYSNGDETLDCGLGDGIGPDTIVFDQALYEGGAPTIDLTQGQMRIGDDLVIDGAGPKGEMLTIDGGYDPSNHEITSRVFLVDGQDRSSRMEVVLSNLKLLHASSDNNAPLDAAASAILGFDTGLKLRNVEIRECAVQFAEGYTVDLRGGALTLEDSLIAGNAGAAVSAQVEELVVERTTISDNGSFETAASITVLAASRVEIKDSTISGNASFNSIGDGGALLIQGDDRTPSVLIENTTVSGNQVHGHENDPSTCGGGILLFVPATLNNLTVTGNAVDGSEGCDLSNSGSGIAYLEVTDPVILHNTIVANNSGIDGETDQLLGSFDASYSLFDHDPGGALNSSVANIFNADPMLGDLAENGGPTKTHAIAPPSPAVDGGDILECPEEDQRGIARPQGVGCDIGAYEFVPSDENRDPLAVFDAAVSAQPPTLEGAGPGNSPDGRLGALRNKLVDAMNWVAQGNIAEACESLLDAFNRTDGAARPPDFAQGDSLGDLNDSIAGLRTDLGCDE